MKWAEFATWDLIAERWVGLGHVAVVPYLIRRLECGESRYLITRTRREFLAACEALGSLPSDLPRDRTSINIDGTHLMKAIIFCRRDTGRRWVGTWEPWSSTCPERGCGLPFDRVASHTIGELVTTTMAGCAAGHRWAV